MTHKQFQHDTIDGGTDVQFNLEYNGNELEVTNIQLHSSFDSGLPNSAYLEYNKDVSRWLLYAYYYKEEHENKVKEWLTSKIANEIVDKILLIKEEEIPKFTD